MNVDKIKKELLSLSKHHSFDMEDAEWLEVLAWHIKQDFKVNK